MKRPSVAPIFLLLGTSILCSACGPIQGYPGPELPDEQTALVELDTDEDVSAVVGEYEFRYRGIRLLPGKHNFGIIYAYRDEPYDCHEEEEFDDYGFRSCLRERDKDIRKNRSYVRTCDYSDYYQRYRECLVPYLDSQCSVAAAVEAGGVYLITFGTRGKSGAPEFRDAPTKRITEVGECFHQTTRTEVERENLF